MTKEKEEAKKVSGSGINKLKNKAKKKSSITVRTVTLGQFDIRVSEAKVVIQVKAKNWDISYYDGTTPYYVIVNLIAKESLDSLRTLVMALYSTSLFFVDANVVKAYIDIVNNFQNTNIKPELSEEEDQKSLEELRAEHGNDDYENEGVKNLEASKVKESKVKTKKEDESNDTLA